MEINYVVNSSDSYLNINDVLNLEFHMSSRLVLKLIKNNNILLNGIPSDTRKLVKENDIISINFNIEEDNSNIVPHKMNLDIVYEDEWLLIVNKPAGIAVHPSILHYEDSLSSGIKYYFDNIGLKKKIRPVNRLDLNTSGLIIFAKCEYIQDALSKQMNNKTFHKEYLSICDGIFQNKSGTLNFPIARKENSIIERCVNCNGQTAITHYKVLKEFKNYSLVQCTLETGRTHQIRVHMAHVGHPLVGDTLYGKTSSLISRQALHSSKIKFMHPISRKVIEFTSPVPEDMKKLLLI